MLFSILRPGCRSICFLFCCSRFFFSFLRFGCMLLLQNNKLRTGGQEKETVLLPNIPTTPAPRRRSRAAGGFACPVDTLGRLNTSRTRAAYMSSLQGLPVYIVDRQSTTKTPPSHFRREINEPVQKIHTFSILRKMDALYTKKCPENGKRLFTKVKPGDRIRTLRNNRFNFFREIPEGGIVQNGETI